MGGIALDLAVSALDEGEASPDEKIVQAPIELYVSSSDAAEWIVTHPDGLP